MLETKLLFNNVILDAKDGARFAGMDLKRYVFANTNENPEYMKMAIKYFPEDIRQRYNLYQLVDNEYIYIKIKKGMYGLNQATLLDYEMLLEIINKAGFHQIPTSLGLLKHDTKQKISSLYVENFGIKYYNMEDLEHLKIRFNQSML